MTKQKYIIYIFQYERCLTTARWTGDKDFEVFF